MLGLPANIAGGIAVPNFFVMVVVYTTYIRSMACLDKVSSFRFRFFMGHFGKSLIPITFGGLSGISVITYFKKVTFRCANIIMSFFARSKKDNSYKKCDNVFHCAYF